MGGTRVLGVVPIVLDMVNLQQVRIICVRPLMIFCYFLALEKPLSSMYKMRLIVTIILFEVSWWMDILLKFLLRTEYHQIFRQHIFSTHVNYHRSIQYQFTLLRFNENTVFVF